MSNSRWIHSTGVSSQMKMTTRRKGIKTIETKKHISQKISRGRKEKIRLFNYVKFIHLSHRFLIFYVLCSICISISVCMHFFLLFVFPCVRRVLVINCGYHSFASRSQLDCKTFSDRQGSAWILYIFILPGVQSENWSIQLKTC